MIITTIDFHTLTETPMATSVTGLSTFVISLRIAHDGTVVWRVPCVANFKTRQPGEKQA
jgi:hypothetical protein